MLPPRAAGEAGYANCRTSLQTIQAEKGSSNPHPHWQNTSAARGWFWVQHVVFIVDAPRHRVSAISLPRVAIPRPDSPPIGCHPTPRVTPCGVQTPKSLLMPEQPLSQHDGSDLAAFLLGKIAPHLGVGTCWSGLAKYLLAALQRRILKKICKSLFSAIFCLGISISAAHRTSQ